MCSVHAGCVSPACLGAAVRRSVGFFRGEARAFCATTLKRRGALSMHIEPHVQSAPHFACCVRLGWKPRILAWPSCAPLLSSRMMTRQHRNEESDQDGDPTYEPTATAAASKLVRMAPDRRTFLGPGLRQDCRNDAHICPCRPPYHAAAPQARTWRSSRCTRSARGKQRRRGSRGGPPLPRRAGEPRAACSPPASG